MRRRVISAGSVIIAIAALGLVLYNATLVDRRPPAVAGVRLSAPVEGETLGQTLTAIDVVFSEPVDTRSVERRFRIEPYVAGTISWDGTTTAIFTPDDKLPPDTEFTVAIAPGFVDLAGNVAPDGLAGWTFRTVGPPVVVEATPGDGTTDVVVDGFELAIRFDRLMDTTSVERAIALEPAVPVAAAWSGRELRLAFPRSLLFGTTYTVTIGTGASDTDGSRLREPFATRFTTVAAGLGVDRVVPAGGVAGISVRSPIAIVFDADVDPASVADALRITPQVNGGTQVLALPSDAAPRDGPPPSAGAGNVLVFTPSEPLAPHTTYSVTLDPVVRRAGSEDVAAGRQWTFTTGQPTVSAQNQIAFLSARSGVANVWLMNPDGSNPRQLTTELVPVSSFDASGDGSRIAWAAGGMVRLMRIDGSDAATLTAEDAFEYAPRFAPDGRSLLVGRRTTDGADAGYALVPLPGVVDVDPRAVLPDGAPPLGSVGIVGEGIPPEGSTAWGTRAAFRPDGRFLVVVTGSGDVRLVDLAPEGGEAPLVTPTGLVATAAPAWSAFDERFLVVARENGGGDWALWSVGTDGSLTRHEPAAGSVAVSADGLIAVLVRDVRGATHVAVRRASEPGEPRPLTAGPELEDRAPAFAPDGRSVLFGRVRPDSPGASAGVWIVDPATGAEQALSTDGAFPRWLP